MNSAEQNKLVEEYLHWEEEKKQCISKMEEVTKKLKELAPHKVGEIIHWREVGRMKNVGTIWHHKYVNLPDRDVTAVLVAIRVTITPHGNVSYDYSFAGFRKDGSISSVPAHPRRDYEWTNKHIKTY